MDKNFLQSEEWRKFQESAGHRTFNISGDNFRANIIEHKLPIVGRYFYIPRGPEIKISNSQFSISQPKADQPLAGNFQSNFNDQIRKKFIELVSLARKNKAGWVRIDLNDSRELDLIEGVKIPLNPPFKKGEIIRKAPHDMQPRQVFIIDISKPEEELLARMKSKTRYNIKLAQKRGVSVKVISNFQFLSPRLTSLWPAISKQKQATSYKLQATSYTDEFLRLVKITSRRNKIKSHSENYYRKMLETIPEKNLKLYVAEYQGKIITANLISFYGDIATYLHGASDNKYRNVMAPFLLQWQAMLDAKKAGHNKYDMGGIKMQKSKIKNQNDNVKYENIKKSQATNYKLQTTSWAGITRFKMGFSPETKPVEFPGSYDIVISPWRYWVYRFIQGVKSLL